MKTVFSLFFPAQFSTFINKWKEALHSTTFKQQTIFTFIIMVIIAVFIPTFFNYIQYTPGYRIDDFVLNNLPARNMSLYIFLLIYAVIILTIINLSAIPILLLRCLQSYCLLMFIRVFCMYLVPLEPEQSIIPLQDPILTRFVYKSSIINKDLFFSGHVSTMALFSFALPFRPLKYCFAIATFFVAIFILIQHVHYTVDVVAAPIFSWVCYNLIMKEKYKLLKEQANGFSLGKIMKKLYDY